VKTAEELRIMRQGGRILATVLREVAAAVRPGISTMELNELAESGLRSRGATPSFLDYGGPENPYPASLCTSVNDAVVHGIPGPTKLEPGDIVGLDLGCWYRGLCTDMAMTVAVGEADARARKLLKCTETALREGLKQVRSGARVGDIANAIQTYAEAQGFSVVRALTGHGVGHAVHEDPTMPNFGAAGTGPKLVAGMTLAIEPMINEGGYEVETLDDGWTVVTADGARSAHFEVTVAVTDKGYELLTSV
jgi:methionyl aminopeptidase